MLHNSPSHSNVIITQVETTWEKHGLVHRELTGGIHILYGFATGTTTYGHPA